MAAVCSTTRRLVITKRLASFGNDAAATRLPNTSIVHSISAAGSQLISAEIRRSAFDPRGLNIIRCASNSTGAR